ncbi:hypothetical protein [Xenorhabdus siamensis]
MRPATFEPQQIIEAGLELQAKGRNITCLLYTTLYPAVFFI